MKLIWQIDPAEIDVLQRFVHARLETPFVRFRIQNNVENPPNTVSPEQFWDVSVGCLLTSQQRSGPDSPVTRLLNTKPFPLSLSFLRAQAEPAAAAQQVLQTFGGIRFTQRIPAYLVANLAHLEDERWPRTQAVLAELIQQRSAAAERSAADFIRLHYTGFGPKQSRNLLQGLGLSRYEIPIDSRITRWLNQFGFPVKLTASTLSDPDYFDFVSDGIQSICRETGLLPCVLDAAIFSSYDNDGWTDENVAW